MAHFSLIRTLMRVARGILVRYSPAMIKNPFARPFIEFVTAHKLSLYRIAHLANISEGTLRAYRDNPGRRLTMPNVLAVANALCFLTKEDIDVIYLFGDGSEASGDANSFIIRPADLAHITDASKTPKLTDPLSKKEFQIDEETFFLLNNAPYPEDEKKVERAKLEQVDSAQLPTLPELLRDLPIRGLKKIDGRLYFTDAPIGFTIRPPSLFGNADAYALHVPDNDMAPRFRPGELIYIDPHWPTQVGSDVLVQVNDNNSKAFALIANLTGQNDECSVFTFYRRTDSVDCENEKITIHKVLTGQELLVR